MLGIAFFFILGIVIGSFLNSVIYRLTINESVANGRSRCFSCQHLLGFFDLVPLASFMWLSGRCRYCQAKISWQYPMVELATGLGFASLYSFFVGWQLAVGLVLLVFSLVVFVYDLRYYLVAEKVVWPIILIMALVNLFVFKLDWSMLAFGAALIVLFFWLQIVVSGGRWLGWGDVLIGLWLGVSLGWPKVLIALVLAYWLGALVGLVLIALGRKDFSSRIPFGPFLLLGLWGAWLFSQPLITLLYG